MTTTSIREAPASHHHRGAPRAARWNRRLAAAAAGAAALVGALAVPTAQHAAADTHPDAPVTLNRPVQVATYAGEQPALPAEVEVTTASGAVEMAPVDWATEDFGFDRHYRTSTVPGLVDGELPVTAAVEVVPAQTVYFVDSGARPATPAYDSVAALVGDGLRNAVADQQAGTDGWGYVNDGGTYVGVRSGDVGDKDETGLWARGRGSTSMPIIYRLPLEAGTYTATAGFREWWSGPRDMRVSVVAPTGETTVISPKVTVSSAAAARTAMVSGTFEIPSGGTAELRVEIAGGTEAPVIGWFGVARGEVAVDTTPLVVAAPTFTPGAGAFAVAQDVSLTSATDGAAIYYTTDGTAPSAVNGTRYAGPFTVAETTTIRAVAVKEGVTSPTATGTYSIEPVPEGGYEYVPVGRTWFDTDGSSIQAHGGGFLEHEGWYYWVGENKRHNSASFLSVNLYRSQDLKNWELVNEILTPESSPELVDAKVERPKLVYNEATETFVLWGHWERASDYSASHLMVATSPTIDGDYTFVRHYRPGVGEVGTDHGDPTYTGGDGLWGYGSRDFTVFKDPDSADAYLVSAEDHMTMRMYKLTDDYTDVDWESSYPLFEGMRREAPALVKAGDRYVLITSSQSGWYPNQALYSTTTDIADPHGWSELETVGNNTTFYSQPTNIMTLEGTDGSREYVYMGDRWNRHALGSSSYVWLPLDIDAEGDDVTMDYRPEWTFDAAAGSVSYPAEILVSEGKPVQATLADPAFPPAAANDGDDVNLNTSGDTSSYYKPAGTPFSWTVELEATEDLSRVDVAFRSYNGSETYSEFTVSGSTDGQTWTRIVDRSANRTVGFTSDAVAGEYRYVRVDVTRVVNDHNGNAASWAAGLVEVQVYSHDRTAPEIGITSPEAVTYGHHEFVDVDVEVTDDGEIASVVAALDGEELGDGGRIDLLGLALGEHTQTVTATDTAGNATTESVTFTVEATVASLQAALDRLAADGSVTDPDVVTELTEKLDAAAAALDSGRTAVAVRQLGAFESQLAAQAGKGITADAAALLTGDSAAVREALG